MRQYLFPIIAFTVVSVLFVVVEVSRPKEVNWTESYALDDKNPFGGYLLFERLQDFNGNKPIYTSNKSIFEELENLEGNYTISRKKNQIPQSSDNDENLYFDPYYDSVEDTTKKSIDSQQVNIDSTDSPKKVIVQPLLYVDTTLTNRCVKCTTYFFVNGSVTPDRYETEMLKKFVAEGNFVVIAANSFGKAFYDSLGIYTRDFYQNPFLLDSTNPKSSISFYPRYSTNSSTTFKITEKRIQFDRYILSKDSLFTRIIASKSDTLPIGMKINYGRGQFLLFSTPTLFTNYGIIKPETTPLVSALLSTLPNNTILWSNYYKFNGTNVSHSILRFILSQEALRWAYYMFLLVSLIYIVFAMKRTQRAIPIVKPVSNDTVDFVNTIGTLFFQSKEHRMIALKKIQYFFDFLRTTYYLNTNNFDKAFFEKASLKLQLPLEDTISLFSKINGVLESDTIDEVEMKGLVLTIDKLIADGQGRKKATV